MNGIKWYSDVAFASVSLEKTRPKKLMMKMITIIFFYHEQIARNDVFGGWQKLTSAMKLRPEK